MKRILVSTWHVLNPRCPSLTTSTLTETAAIVFLRIDFTAIVAELLLPIHCPLLLPLIQKPPLLLPPSPPEVAGTFLLRRLRTTHTAVTSATKARQTPTAMPR